MSNTLEEKEVPKRYKYTFELGEDGHTLHYGGWSVNLYSFYSGDVNTTSSLCGEARVVAEAIVGSRMCDLSYKDFLKWFCDNLGISPRKFFNVVRGKQYELLCSQLPPKVVNAVCYSGKKGHKRVPSNYLRSVKPLLDQCIKDGQDNITPVVAVMRKDPKDLKSLVGKGTWKKLCKNTITRNTLIAHNIGRQFLDREPPLKELVEADIPSTILKSHRVAVHSHDVWTHVSRLAKEGRFIGDGTKVGMLFHTITDTKYMCRDQGEEYNPSWSLNRVIREHERLTKAIKLENLSEDTITHKNYETLPKEFTTEAGKATLLDSEMQVGVEGVDMYHCVGSYAKRCSKGKYAVYHIEATDGEVSTLGLEFETIKSDSGMIKNVAWTLDQHYTTFNKEPSTDCVKVVEDLMLSIKKVDIKDSNYLTWLEGWAEENSR